MAVCLALVLAAAPVASAAVCAGEATRAVAVQSDAAATVMPGPDQAPDKDRTNGSAVCQHCHCHQPGALPTPILSVAAISLAGLHAPAAANSRWPESWTISRLERPPRG